MQDNSRYYLLMGVVTVDVLLNILKENIEVLSNIAQTEQELMIAKVLNNIYAILLQRIDDGK